MNLATLKESAECFEVDPADWFNYWHTHVDWEGEGNSDTAVRRACVEALITMLRRLETQFGQSENYQAWVRIEPSDSGHDAVYLHTPNPHTAYPHGFEGVCWGAEVPDLLAEVRGLEGLDVGESQYEGERTFWLRVG